MQHTENSKRNYFTKNRKLKILNDLQSSDMTLTMFARKLGIHPVTLHKWKRDMSQKKTDEHLNDEEILSENEKLKKENEKNLIPTHRKMVSLIHTISNYWFLSRLLE